MQADRYDSELAEIRDDLVALTREVKGLALCVETLANVQGRLHSVKVPE